MEMNCIGFNKCKIIFDLLNNYKPLKEDHVSYSLITGCEVYLEKTSATKDCLTCEHKGYPDSFPDRKHLFGTKAKSTWKPETWLHAATYFYH
jgi:hypothetical protein